LVRSNNYEAPYAFLSWTYLTASFFGEGSSRRLETDRMNHRSKTVMGKSKKNWTTVVGVPKLRTRQTLTLFLLTVVAMKK